MEARSEDVAREMQHGVLDIAPAEYRHGVHDSQCRIVVVLPEQVDDADRQAALGAAGAESAAQAAAVMLLAVLALGTLSGLGLAVPAHHSTHPRHRGLKLAAA